MRVYRLQHKVTGKGPYTQQVADKSFDLTKAVNGLNSHNCPEPDQDSLLQVNFKKRCKCIQSVFDKPIRNNVDGAFVFGFSNTKQLKKWFGTPGIMKLIAHHGFEVLVRDIPDDKVIDGYSQCLVDIESWFEAETVERWIPERYVGRWSYDEAIA